jgi:hypothetical protein
MLFYSPDTSLQGAVLKNCIITIGLGEVLQVKSSEKYAKVFGTD